MAVVPPVRVTAVILAGGFGTRVRHLLPGIPKPMAPVLGRPFLDWVLAFLRRQGIDSVVLSTGHLADYIADHYSQRTPDGMTIRCAQESTPLGTAGGFLNAARSVPAEAGTTAWLVLNGDSLTVTALKPLLDLLQDPEVDGGLLAVPLDDAARYGTLDVDSDGRLRGFREKQPGAGWVNAGVYLLRDRLLTSIPTGRPMSFETELFPRLLADGSNLRVVSCSADFLDIGTPETLGQVESFVSANRIWF